MDKPRRGPVSKQDWKSQHSQLGAVLNNKSQETGFQGLPLSLSLLSLVKLQWFRQPQLQQPANHLTAGKFTGHIWRLNSETGLPWLLGQQKDFMVPFIRRVGGRGGWERQQVTGEAASDVIPLQPVLARVLGSQPAGGDPGEGSVSRESRGRLPAGPAPPPAWPASLPPGGASSKSSTWSSRKGQSN